MAKLTLEDKIEIFERRENGETISALSKRFNVYQSNIKYLIALIKAHGYDILKNDKPRNYSKEFKMMAIDRVLINNESANSVSIDLGLTKGCLYFWLSNFKKNGYNIIEKKNRRNSKSMTKPKKSSKILTEEEKIKQLEEENLYLRAENEYLKKLRALVQERELKQKKK